LQDNDSDVRRAAVQALAENYHVHEETFPLLKQCLQDNDSDVRRAAVPALAENYHVHEETFPLLKQCLQDNDRDVREAAVQALAILKYDNSIKKMLLSIDLDNRPPWLDPIESITLIRIEKVANKLNLSPEQIYQYYQEISVDIPLQLEWHNKSAP
ncbi:MAG: HEAT repeat domain-containing protein, partial [Aquabacterium sp.]|nr:HEAT repeat domain-containing protein [Aquabacterium sp.]